MSGGWRRCLAPAGLVLVVACLVPPLMTLAHRYLFAETLQFLVFAMVAPALVVLGAPWRALRLGRYLVWRGRRASPLGPWAALAVFVANCLAWRSPPLVDDLAHSWPLVCLEAVILLGAGTLLWTELVASPPLRTHSSGPQQGLIAAVAMWSNWAVAYVLGFAFRPEFHAYDRPGGLLGAVADQEVAVGLVWAVAGVCFVPVVFVTLLSWLNDNGGLDEELRGAGRGQDTSSAVRGWGRRPARGTQQR